MHVGREMVRRGTPGRSTKTGPDLVSPHTCCFVSWLLQCTHRKCPCLLLVVVLLRCQALPPYPREPTGRRSSPLLMVMLCSCHCPRSLVGRYPRSSGSSVMLWATSGTPETYGIGQRRNHLLVRDARYLQ